MVVDRLGDLDDCISWEGCVRSTIKWAVILICTLIFWMIADLIFPISGVDNPSKTHPSVRWWGTAQPSVMLYNPSSPTSLVMKILGAYTQYTYIILYALWVLKRWKHWHDESSMYITLLMHHQLMHLPGLIIFNKRVKSRLLNSLIVKQHVSN